MSRPSAKPFLGFPAGELKQTGVPGLFITEVLPFIDDLVELKVALYAFWFFEQQQGDYRYITQGDYLSDEAWMDQLGDETTPADETITKALAACCRDGILVSAQPGSADAAETVYFLNTPRGRAAAAACQAGKWSPADAPQYPAGLSDVRPNIFTLYEQNIGPLTPMIADELQNAEAEFPQDWIEEAVKLAMESNVRKWRYVLAILRSWKEEGKDAKDRRFAKKDRKKYIQGEYGDFIEH
ncbi:MAG: DnaD domain protein [Anaerolineae bacterium]|nr:DnaD domain protein [Anaerolineae bacterium]